MISMPFIIAASSDKIERRKVESAIRKEETMPKTVKDMSNTFIEHSLVITNFVSIVRSQLSDSLCEVFPDNVQYEWPETKEMFGQKYVVPDASINCNPRNRKNVAFTGIPTFVMEVISEGTKNDDETWKKELYQAVGVSEYWVVDWRRKNVKIFINDDDGNGETRFYLTAEVNQNNKDDLHITLFPNIKITWASLFRNVL